MGAASSLRGRFACCPAQRPPASLISPLVEGSERDACRERAAPPPSAAIWMDDAGQEVVEPPFHPLRVYVRALPWKLQPPSWPSRAQPWRSSPSLALQDILFCEVPKIPENPLHHRCARQTLRPSRHSPALAPLQDHLPEQPLQADRGRSPRSRLPSPTRAGPHKLEFSYDSQVSRAIH